MIVLPLQSTFFRRASRRAFAGAVGCVLALSPFVAGPGSADRISVSWVPASAHKAYAYSVLTAHERDARRGRLWLDAAESALFEPEVVELPYAASHTIDASVADAIGLGFQGQFGRRIAVGVRPMAGAAAGDVFVELFDVSGAAPVLLRSVAPSGTGPSRSYDVDWQGLEDRDLLLRVQPELGFAGDLGIEIRSGPLLGFPVTNHGPRSIQSGFGADRDGGRRAHRGVDIFADRGTEVVASLDSWVSRVDTTPRGGNVVWLQPLFGNLRLYYAHLDTQLVEEGQLVRAGDVLGTVGNTGNAITTPPHLHYGVYLRRRGLRGGARDPVEFLR